MRYDRIKKVFNAWKSIRWLETEEEENTVKGRWVEPLWECQRLAKERE